MTLDEKDEMFFFVSQALTTTRMEFEALEDEANAIHGDLWEQLNAGGQVEVTCHHLISVEDPLELNVMKLKNM